MRIAASVMLVLLGCSQERFRYTEGVLEVDARDYEYVWIWEIVGGDPYKVFPYIYEGGRKLKHVLKHEPTLLAFAFEKEGRLHYEYENFLKFSPRADNLIAYLYLKAGDRETFGKLLQSSEYYDYWDNYAYEFLSRDSIYAYFHLPWNRDDFLHALCLVSDWVIEDDTLFRKIVEVFEGKENSLYKQSCLHAYYGSDVDTLLDPDVPKFRRLLVQRGRIEPKYLLDYAIRFSKGDTLDYESLRNDTSLRLSLAFYNMEQLLSGRSLKEVVERFVSLEAYILAEVHPKPKLLLERYIQAVEQPDMFKPYVLKKLFAHVKDSSSKLRISSILAFYFGYDDFMDTLEIYFPDKLDSLKKYFERRIPKAKDFEVKLFPEGSFKLSENEGKVVVINFWATWCGPCIREIPHLNDVYRTFKDEKVVFIAITGESRDKVEDFLRKHEFLYTIGYDGKDVIRSYNVFAYPTHVIVDAKGRIVFRHVGYTQDLKSRLVEKLRRLTHQAGELP